MRGEEVHRLREAALRAKEGEQEALEQVLTHPDVRNMVYDVAKKLDIPPEDADSIYIQVQEKIWNGIESWQECGKLTTWVYRIAVCACLDLHRSRQQDAK